MRQTEKAFGGGEHGRRWRRRSTVVAAALLVLGCATHRPSTLSDTFIRRGKPSIDLGGPAPSASTEAYVAQLRKLAIEARPRPKSIVPEVAEARDAALRERLAALHAAPTAEHYLAVAQEYRRLGILDAAYSHLSTAIRLNPKDPAPYDLRARVWRAWGLPQLGLRDARKAVELAPQSASAWNTLGLLLEGSGNLSQGTKAYLRAATLDGDAVYVWSNLCRTWTDQSDVPSAVQACRRALAIDPTLQAASLNLQRVERLASPRPGAVAVAGQLAAARADDPATPALPDQVAPLPARSLPYESPRRITRRGRSVDR
jgi:tetratricopeptide (TPR) repeat protein